MCVAHHALVDTTKVYFPPMYIKVGLIEIFVKVMDKESEGFGYLRQKFPKIHKAKLKEGMYVGPKIK
jgi:hypothetical protein